MTGWFKRIVRMARTLFERIGLLFHRHARVAFSQEGEDLVIARLFDGQPTGIYVDVGAYHPTRFSNTYLLYRRGWSGVNIDATPGSMEAFRKRRPRDRNVEIAVGLERGTCDIHVFEEGAVNTLSPDLAEHRTSNEDYRLLDVVAVPVAPLAAILDDNIPSGAAVDLMTIDVEGSDLDVIKSNDWDKYRPRVVVIEILRSSITGLDSQPEIEFLAALGYDVHAKLHNSVVLLDRHRGDEGMSG